MIVLDASALLALLRKEPGHEKVAEKLSVALISAVNFAEVLSGLVRRGIYPNELAPRIKELGIRIIPFEYEQALIAAAIREHARAAGVGLADCCCLALALKEQLPVLTSDRAWKLLGLALDIQLIR